MTKIWGPSTWCFLHSFIARLDDDKFETNKNNIIEFIRTILANLPCPICSDHAIKYINTKIRYVNKKNDLCLLFYHFHNEVTKRTTKYKKPELPDIDILNIYKNNNVKKEFNIYYEIWQKSTNQRNILTMTSSFMKHSYINNAIQWLKHNNHLLEKGSFVPY